MRVHRQMSLGKDAGQSSSLFPALLFSTSDMRVLSSQRGLQVCNVPQGISITFLSLCDKWNFLYVGLHEQARR
jgi:hypothetical protein